MRHQGLGTTKVDRVLADQASSESSWTKRYGQKHRLHWIRDFPMGIAGPRRVRIYQRAEHFVLQWWDKAAKRNLSERVEGDLVAAIARARQIDERLEHFRSSGQQVKRASHEELIDRFLADLKRRADAGEIEPKTVARYMSALDHYRRFVDQPDIQRQYPRIGSVNREFALVFAAYLNQVLVLPNGHAHSQPRPMRRPDLVVDVVRAMYQWAADPDRGRLVPEGFRNPFARRARHDRRGPAVHLGDPDISLAMAAEFLAACDPVQLPLFAPMVLYGLRAAEPCFLFRESLDGSWLNVPCLPELAYLTKGRREKRLPLLPALKTVLAPLLTLQPSGVLYLRRGVIGGKEKPPLVGASLDHLVHEFQRRCALKAAHTAVDRQRIRDQVLHDAGGIDYDQIVGEFSKLARSLGWPKEATLKDFRHLFATCLENAGMPEHYRKYLLGHSPGRAASVHYTHLNEIRDRFEEAVERKLRPLIDALVQRASQIG